MSRARKSIINFIYAILGQGLGLIISFISRIFFIRILGSEYLGLNGLFTNILTVLCLTELGVGSAINYSLYKPLADQDIRKCQMLMQFYKKVYILIGVIIIILGISITPFLNFFIKDMPNIQNINLIYILFVINTAVSYFYSYKKNLIEADQKTFITTIYHYTCNILLHIFQIIYLIITKNYIGFLIMQIIATLIENILISKKADKMYPYLKNKRKIKLDNITKNDIISKTKAMMMHKVGSVVVNSTDNILISGFVSLTSVGIYSNYALIITNLNTIIGHIYSSVTASVGNLCANSSKTKQYIIYKNINFLTFWIYSFCSICLLVLFNPFIEIWIGKEYLFDISLVLVLVINFYISGMRKSVMTFKEAMGLFEKDKYKAIIESIINLIASIILVKKIGVLGIFLGTFISSITTCVWVEPYVLYKYGFQRKISLYFKNYLKQVILTIIMASFTYFICSFINFNIYISFILKGIVCLIIPNAILYFIYGDSRWFKYFYNKIFFKIIRKIKKA